MTLTGVEEGGFYNEASMPLLINYFDNNEMERLNIQVVNGADENDVIDSVEYLADDGAIEAASGNGNRPRRKYFRTTEHYIHLVYQCVGTVL